MVRRVQNTRRRPISGAGKSARKKRKEVMADVLDEVERIASEARAELAAVKDAAQLEQWRIEYLGTNGLVKKLPEKLKTAPKEGKAALGQRINAVKNEIESG